MSHITNHRISGFICPTVMAGDGAFARFFGAVPAINVTGAAPDYFCRHLKNLPEADDVMPFVFGHSLLLLGLCPHRIKNANNQEIFLPIHSLGIHFAHL